MDCRGYSNLQLDTYLPKLPKFLLETSEELLPNLHISSDKYDSPRQYFCMWGSSRYPSNR